MVKSGRLELGDNILRKS